MKPDAFPGNLSLLQQDLLSSLGRGGGEGFFLTGGSALVGFYGHRRTTRDLDLFTRATEAFQEGPTRLEIAADAVGAAASPIRTHPTFRRYRVTRGEEETLVDLVLEAVPPVHPPQPIPGSRLSLDCPEEIAVNKICALVGRGEPRDLEDLLFLSQGGVDLDLALEEARAKNGEVGPDTLLMVLPDIPLPPGVDPGALCRLEAFRHDWIRRLRLEVLPPE